MTNTTYSSAHFTISYDEQDPYKSGWSFRFVGTTHEGELVTNSGPIDDTRDLLNTLLAYAPADYDTGDLPTFGGSEPDCTVDVYSWDDTHLIVGCQVQGLARVPR
jgi:hypothetical protein